MVRRDHSMDPARATHRAGLPALFAFLIVTLFPQLAVATQGSSAKVTRDVSFSESQDTHPSIVQRVRISRIVFSTDPAPRRKPEPTREGYLPACGPAPLRYAAPDSWPPPLPVAEVHRLADAVKAAALPVLPPAESSPDPVPDSHEVITLNAESHATTSSPNVDTMFNSADPTSRLTADVVLGYLGKLPAGRNSVPEQFQPTIPAVTPAPLQPLQPVSPTP